MNAHVRIRRNQAKTQRSRSQLVMERSTNFWLQAISLVASVTAAMSTIVVSQLTKRFAVSYHSSTPRWKYTVVPLVFYLAVFVCLLVFAMFSVRNRSLSRTVAFMTAPSVPLHGFLWALVPQTRHVREAPSTDSYVMQCFRRKPIVLLVLTWIPFILGVILAGLNRSWQALAVQIVTAVAFLATGSTPETPVRARETSFGRTTRYMTVPKPGRRNDTVGYTIDLQREQMLEPVRLDMGNNPAYLQVSVATMGRLEPVKDDKSASETPVFAYLDSFVEKLPKDRIVEMTGQLWRTLEVWKTKLREPVADIFLLYALVERMAFIAYRPTGRTIEEHKVAVLLNFFICHEERGSERSEFAEAANNVWDEWKSAGEWLLRSEHWSTASMCGSRGVDLDVPIAEDILKRISSGDPNAEMKVIALGSAVHFVRYVFAHDEQLVEAVVKNIPFYHNRITNDVCAGVGGISPVCRGIILSMKRKGLLLENVSGHGWASSGGALRWGPGGYALLDQAYARNSALAYVVQLGIIVVNAILEN